MDRTVGRAAGHLVPVTNDIAVAESDFDAEAAGAEVELVGSAVVLETDMYQAHLD